MNDSVVDNCGKDKLSYERYETGTVVPVFKIC